MKGNTDFWEGFKGPEAIATKPIGKMKYFDYNKAKDIILKAIKEGKDCISIGLLEDWDNTSGVIYRGTINLETYIYIRSFNMGYPYY